MAILILQTSVYSQQPSYKNFGTESGLPNLTIYKINQDSKGIIWMATEKGMCSYDGYTFKSYTSTDYQDFIMLNLSIDDKDRVWHFNLSGKLYVIENGKVRKIKGLKYSNAPIVELEITDDVLHLMFNVGSLFKQVSYRMEGDELQFIKERGDAENRYVTMGSRRDTLFTVQRIQDESFLALSNKNEDLNEMRPISSTYIKGLYGVSEDQFVGVNGEKILL